MIDVDGSSILQRVFAPNNTFKMGGRELEHGKVETRRLEQLVYTYHSGAIAGEVGIFDSTVSIIVDGPSRTTLAKMHGKQLVRNSGQRFRAFLCEGTGYEELLYIRAWWSVHGGQWMVVE